MGTSEQDSGMEELRRLRELAMICYAGLVAECGLPEKWADVFFAASSGEPFSTEGLLPFVASSSVQGEAEVFPELLEGSEGLYVRREARCGFSIADCRRVNAIRFSSMRNGEHITSEDAVSFARAILSEFTTPPPAPAAEPVRVDGLKKALAQIAAVNANDYFDGGVCAMKRIANAALAGKDGAK